MIERASQQVSQCIQSKLCLKLKCRWNLDLITVEWLKILKTQWPTLRVFQPSSSRLLPLVCQLQPLICQLQMFAVLVWNAQVTILLSTQNSCISKFWDANWPFIRSPFQILLCQLFKSYAKFDQATYSRLYSPMPRRPDCISTVICSKFNLDFWPQQSLKHTEIAEKNFRSAL